MSRGRRRKGNRRSNADDRSQRNGQGNGQSKGQRRADGTSFWGDPSALPTEIPEVRITDDAAAVPRSLGEPPLPGHREVAEHYFAAIYDRAVATAGALAAAGGLIEPDQLAGRRDQDE